MANKVKVRKTRQVAHHSEFKKMKNIKSVKITFYSKLKSQVTNKQTTGTVEVQTKDKLAD